ncbi:MAG: hypothetical protein AAFY24_17110 [Pseudomonadota bacterium]
MLKDKSLAPVLQEYEVFVEAALKINVLAPNRISGQNRRATVDYDIGGCHWPFHDYDPFF